MFLIDWEFSGWMPAPWEALKATWLCFDTDDEWLSLMKATFSEYSDVLDADWLWRSESGVTIL